MKPKNIFSKFIGAFTLALILSYSTSTYATSDSDSRSDDRSDDHYSNDKDSKSSDNHGDSVPLDGGLGILLLGAAAFGVKKLRENK